MSFSATTTSHRIHWPIVYVMFVGILLILAFFLLNKAEGQVTTEQYLGRWEMIFQVSSTPTGEITHNFVNKIITISQTESGGYLLKEDYGQMELFNPEKYPFSQCESSGGYVVPIEITAGTITIDGAQRKVTEEPNISCSPSGTDLGGTNAVPLSLTVSGKAFTDNGVTDSSWKFTLKGDTLIAAITLGPSTTTQTYQRVSVAPSDGTDGTDLTNQTNTNKANTNDTQDSRTDFEDKLQEEARVAYEANREKPIQYSALTTAQTVLTPEQQAAVRAQLEADLQVNTQLVVNATNNVIQVTREVGWRARPPRVQGEVTLIGQLDRPTLAELGLPIDAPVYIVATVFSTPIVKIAQADQAGAWTLTIPAELLSTDEHVVYAAADTNGITTNQIEVTKFVVEEQVRLSNTTWLVAINALILGIILIVLLMVRIRRSKQKQAYI